MYIYIYTLKKTFWEAQITHIEIMNSVLKS